MSDLKEMLPWIGLLLCTGAIVYCGTRLSRYGDIIAEKTGLGRSWIGVVLIASVTSLPELVTGLSSVTIAGVPDIATGDVLGSCVFNMLIFAALDALYKQAPISSKAQQGNVLSAAFGILLLGVAGAGLFLGGRVAPLGWIGPYSLLIVAVYVLAMRIIFYYEKRQVSLFMRDLAVELKYQEVSTSTAIKYYAGNALIVVGAAVFLPSIGERIAEATGLGQTFVGSIFIALSTSLPEVVVSVSAVKMGAIDLAVGNLFGSNVFNIFILGIDDFFFVRGPILAYVSLNHMVSIFSAMAMTAVAIIGLTYRREKKRLIAWDSGVIIIVYVVNLMLLYMLR